MPEEKEEGVEAARRRLARVGVVFLAALTGISIQMYHLRADGGLVSYVDSSRLAEGLERFRFDYALPNGKRGQIHAIFGDPKKVGFELVMNPERKPVAHVRTDAMVVANAAYFTPDFRPTGLLVSNGKTISPFVRGAGGAGSGVFVLENGAIELLERDKVGTRSFGMATLAIQAGPRIIEPDGSRGIHRDDGTGAHRTVIGADARGHLALAIIVGGSEPWAGPSLYETQLLLGPNGLGAERPELELRFALNLDGGPSSAIEVRHSSYRLSIAEGSPVLSILALSPIRP
ncbi:MAG: phosphodiester glycosidase family protein [Deltaproteobacteria bacterium]|nr:phosphodiester glycosidase family protein [Deltaproteobacteria bacterium]